MTARYCAGCNQTIRTDKQIHTINTEEDKLYCIKCESKYDYVFFPNSDEMQHGLIRIVPEPVVKEYMELQKEKERIEIEKVSDTYDS